MLDDIFNVPVEDTRIALGRAVAGMNGEATATLMSREIANPQAHDYPPYLPSTMFIPMLVDDALQTEGADDVTSMYGQLVPRGPWEPTP